MDLGQWQRLLLCPRSPSISNGDVGYLIGCHVAQICTPLQILLNSLTILNGIEHDRIVVVVNGCCQNRTLNERGIRFVYRIGEAPHHFQPLVNDRIGDELSLSHWLYVNCTSNAGEHFRELVEEGFEYLDDATLASDLMPRNPTWVDLPRAQNDMALYRYGYLLNQIDLINKMDNMVTQFAVANWEGLLYGLAPRKAQYKNVGLRIVRPPADIYGNGTLRQTEYFAAIDLYRYKKNYGQLTIGTYDPASV